MRNHTFKIIRLLSCVALLVSCGNCHLRAHDFAPHHHLPTKTSSSCLAAAAADQPTLAITPPAAGVPPRPSAVAVRPPADDPASLVISAPAAGVAPRPTLAKTHLTAADLATGLQHIDHLQCQISQALFDRQGLQSTVAWWTARGYQAADDVWAQWQPTAAGPVVAPATPQPRPQFVAFPSVAGDHLVPLQRQALAAASQQLQVAGNALLGLSRALSDLSGPRLATKSLHPHR